METLVTAALYGTSGEGEVSRRLALPTAPAAMTVVSRKDSPCCHELTGESGFFGKVALLRVHEPHSVACPSIEVFGASSPTGVHGRVHLVGIPAEVSGRVVALHDDQLSLTGLVVVPLTTRCVVYVTVVQVQAAVRVA
ncbi:hypothetical protein [Streptomyces sp. CB00455]|uniref:hypothetical protein n=1 Tax=Streptomyces sp. CB00455 TaxID=1703927 RepID=UPI0011610425|nr:hypothetical protein [Streptomyces sp. CB00455]